MSRQYQREDQTTKEAWEAAALAAGRPLSAFNLYVGKFVSWVKVNGSNPPSPFLPTPTP